MAQQEQRKENALGMGMERKALLTDALRAEKRKLVLHNNSERNNNVNLMSLYLHCFVGENYFGGKIVKGFLFFEN